MIDHLTTRLRALEAERDRYLNEVNQRLAFYAGAIAELDRIVQELTHVADDPLQSAVRVPDRADADAVAGSEPGDPAE